ncbi:MAG: DUF4349 domain-containing protein [Leptospiraceae bacterium]|nr:DUF4349 domain-containing protein [Leptospiraceae bacterium]
MKILLILIILFVGCKKSKEPSKEGTNSRSQTEAKKVATDEEMDLDEATQASKPTNSPKDEESRTISKPTDIISSASKTRFLEYKINLNFKVKDIHEVREEVLKIIKKESFLANSSIDLYGSHESMTLEIHSPSSSVYETLLALAKIGELKSETVSTTDWTELNELQKIKLQREATRISRRSKAVAKGNSESWTLKDREEALERSEDSEDLAKHETWKIKDKVTWVKLYLNISGKELPTKIVFPDYRNEFVSSLNYILSFTGNIVYLLPILLILFLLYRAFIWYRNRP